MRNRATMFNGGESHNPAIPDAAVGQKLLCTILLLAICHGGCRSCFFHYTEAFFVQQAELLLSAINHWSIERLLQPAVALRRVSLKRATSSSSSSSLWTLWLNKKLSHRECLADGHLGMQPVCMISRVSLDDRHGQGQNP
ncbi:hypothetical protein T11_11966 [Trichinella zimbabwensis]|uniref:Uncharacterized protein n=1 Tax=Trichinella zimbabwensis TaxID=268475 RepID=A0A0V1H300_9BILA|nr:hypothetical protein T11_11966 [Trichinella zimbabwensis]